MRINVNLYCLILSVLLAGCISSPPRDTDGLRDIIPTAEKDYGPSEPVALSHIPDAIPKVEKRTAAGNKSPYKVKGVVYRVMSDPAGYSEVGLASWYGLKFQGRPTSNGETYDMYAMTAAHKTLPIPSYVRVTNLSNKRSIVVRVNDRGPFAHGRIIDLSYAGAQKLGYVDAGTTKVRVEYIDPLTSPLAQNTTELHAYALPQAQIVSGSVPQRFLQVGAFGDVNRAKNLQARLASITAVPVSIIEAEGSSLFRVQIGPLASEESVLALEQLLSESGVVNALRVIR